MVMTAQQLADLMPDATQLESNEPEMESSLHYAQLALLVACLDWLWRERTDFFIGANLTIYSSREQLKKRDFRGPDFFIVNQTQRHLRWTKYVRNVGLTDCFLKNHIQRRHRKSWVVWEEDGRYPDLIIELLSPATAKTDRTLKKVLYQDCFRTPEYFWFSPETLEFEGYRLVGQHYDAIAPNASGHRWSEVLGLFLGVQDNTLRYFHPSGEPVPTPEEAAAAAQARADRLAEQLKALGVEPKA
ncbi:Uma2 family endonuclease [Nodosilinea sp. E11]|uniref:Uma2 family endonuclease n=1 Tax=Nodosilinea sp. E11 TaxID=3037479 RepID=UPI002934E283|nr:Uma2 family endonuclease [Nodosilinea sp. E11]WOD41047.1 Uma2 family endonuclease [Nodosilinea sp. E11]